MINKINDYLTKIETVNKIHILYACESGSRMWNIACKDSDFDVRFVYHRFVDGYITLNKVNYVIDINNSTNKELITDAKENNIDIVGWDIKKYLSLLAKSNSSCIEWLESPIKYRIDNYFYRHIMRSYTPFYFNFKRVFYSYLGLAKSNAKKYLLEDKIYIKKYLYSIRPILICLWMLENPDKKQMPLDFNVLINYANKPIGGIITKIFKINRVEKQKTPRIEEFDDFINYNLEYLDRMTKEDPLFYLNEEPKSQNIMDNFLRNIIIKGY
jgi:uncharacterized protein